MRGLPNERTSFVGREWEIAEVTQLLGHTPMVTLTGPGGCGKTRLAIRVAGAFDSPHGLAGWFVDLAPAADRLHVEDLLSAALIVVEERDKAPIERLAETIGGTEALLVLDNCEHLLDVLCPLVRALLEKCSGLKVLATSRAPLKLVCESVWQVPALSSPPTAVSTIDDIRKYESLRLFLDRSAGAVDLSENNVPVMAEICRRLEGMPLAIELAAARTNVLTPQQILERLQDSLRTLALPTTNASSRHQSLAATMEWSYRLLPTAVQAAYRDMAVFKGGFSLEAAEAVCGPNESDWTMLNSISLLVDNSLLIADTTRQVARYRMLETVRQHAYDRLRQTESHEHILLSHCRYFLQLAEAIAAEERGNAQSLWVRRLEAEHENFRAALQWAVAADPQTALRLAAGLGWFWQIRGFYTEGREWLTRALTLHTQPSSERARALFELARLAFFQGDYDTARSRGQESAEIYRDLGDARAAAGATNWVARSAYQGGDLPMARVLLEECLLLTTDEVERARSLWMMGEMNILAGDLATANNCLEGSLKLSRGRDAVDEAAALAFLGVVHFRQRALTTSKANLSQALSLYVALGHGLGIASVLDAFAMLAVLQSQHERALRLAAAAESVRRPLRAPLLGGWRNVLSSAIRTARETLASRAEVFWQEGLRMSLNQAFEYAISVEPRAPAPTSKMTPRERDVAALISSGYSNRKIASTLVLSERTVDNHVQRIMNKLDFHSRSQIAAWATEHGLALERADQ